MKNSDVNKIKTFLSIRQDYQEAKTAYEEAEAEIKDLLASIGGKVEIDGVVLTLVEAQRRSFDVTTLKDLVSTSVFRKITEPSVKTTLFDAAVKLGQIDDEVIDQVVSVTPYTQLKVK